MNAQLNQPSDAQINRPPVVFLTQPGVSDKTVLTQAERTFRAAGFDPFRPLAGTLADGGSLWIEAQKVGATFDQDLKAIVFRDTSQIAFQNNPASMYQTTYTPVAIDPVRFNVRLARHCSLAARRMKGHESPSLAQSFRAARALCMVEARAARQRLLAAQSH